MKFSKVKSIKDCGKKDIYHLSVEKNKNFFANEICLHNCSYRGEIKIILINHEVRPFEVKKGDRIAQLIITKSYILPVEEVKEFPEETERGEGGFGSTDKGSKVNENA